uniref:Uncharacterized protein n=1 Tax=Tanacetum cinerariifolium TaxID=118510 RepID=A0A699IZS7_TANCI|nr:hypothetical protein [Tanacetum cinerariifolium]
MIAILEKYEHNADFHPIVDFVEASYIRRNLKLKDEAGISSLPDAELFKNLTLMGYNISPNQKFSFQKGTPTKPHHTPSPEAPQSPQHDHLSPTLPSVTTEPLPTVIPTDTPLRQYTKRARIAQSFAILTIADEPASPLGDDSQDLYTRLQRQQNKMASKLTAQDLEIASLKARIKMLEDKDRGGDDPYGEDAIIKGRSLETGEEAGIERSTNKGSNNTEEMVNVLTSLDAASILTSGVQVSVPLAEEVGTVSIPPAGEIPTISVPTSSGVVLNASPIFTTAIVATPYSRRKGKEKMVESKMPKKKKHQEQIDVQMARQMEEEMSSDAQRMNEQIARDAKIARIHAEEELQMLIDSLDRINEMIAKYLQEYEQFAKDLSIGERIELLMIWSHAGWKTKHFKGMSLEERREKFVPVWKQIEDFIPMGSKEEGERFKRKGIRLEQDSANKAKTSEEVSEEDLKIMMLLVPLKEVYMEALHVKHPIIDLEIHTEWQKSYWKIIRLGGSTTSYQFFVDLLKHIDKEDLNQLWALVKETLNIRQATSDKEKEL